MIGFFFSSRRRHTRWPRDWSSDVCSSDLRRLTKKKPIINAPVDRSKIELGSGVEAVAVTVGNRLGSTPSSAITKLPLFGIVPNVKLRMYCDPSGVRAHVAV